MVIIMDNSLAYVEFHVTGILRNGKRFKKVYSSALFAMSINLYSGSVYGVLDDGTRKLLKRVCN